MGWGAIFKREIFERWVLRRLPFSRATSTPYDT